jgi:hypothetical protein
VLIIIKGKRLLFNNRNFLFESASINIKFDKGITVNIIDANIGYIEIRNISNRIIIIERKCRLNIIAENYVEGCYLIEEEFRYLIYRSMSVTKKAIIINYLQSLIETIFENGITVYGNEEARTQFIDVI